MRDMVKGKIGWPVGASIDSRCLLADILCFYGGQESNGARTRRQRGGGNGELGKKAENKSYAERRAIQKEKGECDSDTREQCVLDEKSIVMNSDTAAMEEEESKVRRADPNEWRAESALAEFCEPL